MIDIYQILDYDFDVIENFVEYPIEAYTFFILVLLPIIVASFIAIYNISL